MTWFRLVAPPPPQRGRSFANSRQLIPVGVATAALIATGCGVHHQSTDTGATKAANTSTQMLPNTAPDGGAPSVTVALSRYTTALTRLDAVEAWRLLYYVDAACVSRLRLAYNRIRASSARLTTRVISTTGTGDRTIVVLQITYRVGQKQTTQRDRLGFGSRNGRWFIGPAD